MHFILNTSPKNNIIHFSKTISDLKITYIHSNMLIFNTDDGTQYFYNDKEQLVYIDLNAMYKFYKENSWYYTDYELLLLKTCYTHILKEKINILINI